ncbi:MAG: hypothetical protein M1835_003200, partial [Candelina submexicana]
MALGGILLKSGSTFIRLLQLLGSALILGIFSYFLAVLTRNDLHTPTWVKAVEGMAGAATLYSLFTVGLTFFLGGITILAFLAILLDLCFVGAMVAIAILSRGGAHKCRGIVNTPIGDGMASDHVVESSPHTTYLKRACQLEMAAFITAIILALLFLISMLMQYLLNRHHKKEKAFGPSPANDYTSGKSSKTRFWKRKNNAAKKPKHLDHEKDTELGVVGAGVGAGAYAAEDHHHNRNSGVTAYTGSTVAAPDHAANGHTHKHHEREPTVPAVANDKYISGAGAPTSRYDNASPAPLVNPTGHGHGVGGHGRDHMHGGTGGYYTEPIPADTGIEHAGAGYDISGYGAQG